MNLWDISTVSSLSNATWEPGIPMSIQNVPLGQPVKVIIKEKNEAINLSPYGSLCASSTE